MKNILIPKSEDEVKEVLDKIPILTSQKEIDRCFWDGVPEQNMYKVHQAIKSGFDVNGADEDGLVPLMYAAVWDNPETLKALIQAGAKVDQNLIDKMFDIAFFQVEPRTYYMSRILVSLGFMPSKSFSSNMTERISRFIKDAWENYISVHLLKAFPREGITNPPFPVNLSYQDFYSIYMHLVKKVEEENDY